MAREVPEFNAAGWALESAEERARAHPNSFQLPSRAVREALEAGNAAKVLAWFVDDGTPACERLWVVVASRDGTTYTGRLDSQPSSSAAPLDRLVLAEREDSDRRLEVQSNDDEEGPYCVVVDGGATHYGGIQCWQIRDGALEVVLTKDAATVLGVPKRFAIEIVDSNDVPLVRDTLNSIVGPAFRAGSPPAEG